MRKIIVSALAFAAMTTAAVAQSSITPVLTPPPVSDDRASPPLPGGPDAMDLPDETSHDYPGQSLKDDSRQDMGMRRHHWPMPPPPSKAAHFRVEEGDRKIDIKCADDEPTKVCADVLLQLIDKLSRPSAMSDDEQG
jgi:hypothetical protein